MGQPIVLRSRQDVVDLVNKGTIGQTRFWIVLIAIGGTFIDAYDMTSLGIGAIQLREEFHLTAGELGTITASMAIGALFGALFGGYYVDKVGRLRMFLLDLFFFVISAIGAALAPNYYVAHHIPCTNGRRRRVVFSGRLELCRRIHGHGRKG